MDYLSRLIAGSGASPTKQRTSNTPAERLAVCKRTCNALQHLWRNGGSISENETVQVQIAGYIKRLNSILQDESRKTAPHSCLQYACSTQIFIIVTKLAISAEDETVTEASAHFFHLLINGETENLLDSKIFARSLIDLVRKSRGMSENVRADLVELLFEICAKIRIDPDILPAWFYPERGQSPPNARDDEFRPPRRSASTTRQDQFPLFYVLVDFVHNDGSSGDFARTGLLYLIEMTSKSQILEKWMIESDLAPQMASGLGALYSRLSRAPALVPPGGMFSSAPLDAAPKRQPKKRPRMPGGFDDGNETEQEDLLHDDRPTEVSQSVHAFMSYLAFWQDTLNHCSSTEVAETLLDHFQILFVQQLLYPSLLESSDVDGGSTAAVIAHLYRILDSLEQRQMLRRILDYLLSFEQRQALTNPQRRKRLSVSRRKSMDKLAAMIESSEEPSPDLFNLLDLIALSLKSSRSQTSTAALKLISVMLRKHHDLVFTTLFKLKPCDPVSQTRGAYDQELTVLFQAALGIMDTPMIEQSYQTLLEDVRFMLNEHSCELSLADESAQILSTAPGSLEVQQDSRLMNAICDLFTTFFANEIMTNVALTETVICLASCKLISLRGWLIHSVDPSTSTNSWSILDLLEDQISQIRRWRSKFIKWDELFMHQQLKLIGDPAGVAITSSPQQSSFDQPSSPSGLGISKASPHISVESPRSKSSIGQSLDVQTPSKLDLENLLQNPVDLLRANEPPITPDTLPSLAERLSLEPRMGTSSASSEGMSSGAVTPSLVDGSPRSTVSLGHILTNAVILQEFLLEIAAVVQLRASMFGEVQPSGKE